MEKISVIIPAYCAERYLAEAVESVRKQCWAGRIEIIIVNDGSEDHTLEIAQGLGDIVLTKKRGGAASARNLGIRKASGELFLLLDADDTLSFGALMNLYEPFVAHTEIMAVFGKARDFLSPELTLKQKSELCIRKKPYSGFLSGCALIRREVFDRLGLFDEALKTGETVAWQIKLRDAKIPTLQIDDVTVNRRLHMNNTGRLAAFQEMSDYAEILRRRMKKL